VLLFKKNSEGVNDLNSEGVNDFTTHSYFTMKTSN